MLLIFILFLFCTTKKGHKMIFVVRKLGCVAIWSQFEWCDWITEYTDDFTTFLKVGSYNFVALTGNADIFYLLLYLKCTDHVLCIDLCNSIVMNCFVYLDMNTYTWLIGNGYCMYFYIYTMCIVLYNMKYSLCRKFNILAAVKLWIWKQQNFDLILMSLYILLHLLTTNIFFPYNYTKFPKESAHKYFMLYSNYVKMSNYLPQMKARVKMLFQ